MRCFSDVLKKTLPCDVFGDVLEKVKHLTNDAFNDVSRPALGTTFYIPYQFWLNRDRARRFFVFFFVDFWGKEPDLYSEFSDFHNLSVLSNLSA